MFLTKSAFVAIFLVLANLFFNKNFVAVLAFIYVLAAANLFLLPVLHKLKIYIKGQNGDNLKK